jgi:proteasome lid subunit RPN8/RPN11
VDALPETASKPAAVPPVAGGGREDASAAPQRVLGVSARTVTDETIWEMLSQLFDAKKVAVESVGSAYLASEVTAVAERQPPDLVCVISIPPGGLAQARYICRRLRAKLPLTPILVIRPGVQANRKQSAQRLTEDGANQVCFTLEDARTAAEQQLVIHQLGIAKAAPADAV